MLLRFYFVTPHYGQDVNQQHPFNQPYLDDAFNGIYEAELALFGSSNTDNWDDLLAYNPEGEQAADLKIKKLPAFIIYDVERQRALFKLEKGQITRENVKAACVAAWSLTPNPVNQEEYILPTGQTVGTGQLMNAKPCPKWLPGFLCNQYGQGSWNGAGFLSWLLIGLLLFLVYKMLR